MERRHEQVRRAARPRAGRSARRGRSRSALIPASASASLSRISSVVSDLTFTTSRAPVLRTSPVTISFASSASRAQCTSPPARSNRLLELDEQLVEPVQRVRPDRLTGPAEVLPVGRLADDGRAPGADRRRRVEHVGPRPRVGERGRRSLLERDRSRRAARGRPHAASTSARWTARTGLRRRSSPPRDVEEARGVAGADGACARRLHVAQLVGEHRATRSRVPDGERAAEAAALGRVRERSQLDARHPAQQRLGPVADAQSRAASGRSGGT